MAHGAQDFPTRLERAPAAAGQHRPRGHPDTVRHPPDSGARSEAEWLAASLALVGLIATANLLLGSTDFSGVLMIGPLMASTQIRTPRTAVVSVVAVVLAALTMIMVHDQWDPAAAIRLVGVAAGAAFAVAAAHWREEREQKLTAVSYVAEVTQRAILTPLPPMLGDVRMASRYRSAAAEAVVGGDFYDAIDTPSGVRVLVGDVKGKGLDAVRLAARVVGAFRLAALRDDGLDEVARDLHECVSGGLADEDFVTAVLVQISSVGTVEVVNCGHPPPIVISEAPKPLVLSACAPLGLGEEFTVERVDLPAGARLLLHTDGILEARDAAGTFFDVEAAVAAEASILGNEEFLDRLLEHVDVHTENCLGDDLALVVLSSGIPANKAGTLVAAQSSASPVG